MKILILGADGYLGWPTAMHLSKQGHDVVVVDSYLKREIIKKENLPPLVNPPTLEERSNVWSITTGHNIEVFIGDLVDWTFVENVFSNCHPDVIVHFAEQPSAPHSMKNRETATLTLHNNLMVTANVIFAVREYCPDAHLIKLGTMGEYGTPNIDIEEGWLDVEHKGRNQKFLYPRQAGSLYHTTKIMDTDLLWFYVRMWGLRATDLMQGPVYGLFTGETNMDEGLLPFFHYDESFGTVLNRFVVQAAIDFPLTVYGKGNQTRGYLNIKDTLNCIALACENPPEKGELKILNQFTETFSVNQLAEKVCHAAEKIGIKVVINNIDNPRKELEEHYYNPVHTGLLEMGLKPNYLNDDVLIELLEYVVRHKEKINRDIIFKGIKWA